MANRTGLPFDLLLERKQDEPIHRQIYSALRNHILEGRLVPDANLPGSRLLARHLGVGRNTVLSAYDQLLAEGYVEARSGSGTFVVPLLKRPRPRQSAASHNQLKFSRRGDLIASQAQPCRTPGRLSVYPGAPETRTFPFSIWSRLLARVARRADDDLVAIQNYSGSRQLRQAIAEYLGVARGVACAADQVIVVTGAQAALDLTARVLMDEGENVWMEEPGYLGARGAFLAGGARLWPLRVSRQGWSLRRPRPSSTPPDLCHPVLSLAAWRDHAHGRAPGAVGPRRASQSLDHRGRLRWRIPLPRPTGARAVRAHPYRSRDLHRNVRKDDVPDVTARFPGRAARPFEFVQSRHERHRPIRSHVASGRRRRIHQAGTFCKSSRRMRRLYARRQEHFLQLCRRHLGEWLRIEENDSGMQLLGQIAAPISDDAVVEFAARKGVDLQSVSINYYHDAPRQGILFGYAALNEQEALRTVMALRETFREIERSVGSRRQRREAAHRPI